MKLTVVVDNSVPISNPNPFLGEHGFSVLIEINSSKILLDTGQSDIVLHNLSLLGVHPNQLDGIVLSHGHYDHTGGLAFLLKHRDKPIPVYGHMDIFQDRYSVAGGRRRYIGIPYRQEELTSMGAQWHLTDKPIQLLPGLIYSGQVPRKTGYETGDDKLITCGESGCDCQDIINDDSSLYFSCKEGMVVISGCTHSGLVNSVEHGFKITGKNHLLGWLGGTHLGPVSKQQQGKTLEQIEKYAPNFVSASHCTGFSMMAELQRRFGDRFVPGFVGQVIEVN